MASAFRSPRLLSTLWQRYAYRAAAVTLRRVDECHTQIEGVAESGNALLVLLWPPPIAHAPKPMSETLHPILPKVRYLMIIPSRCPHILSWEGPPESLPGIQLRKRGRHLVLGVDNLRSRDQVEARHNQLALPDDGLSRLVEFAVQTRPCRGSG